jgi:hypothetical protein
MPIVIAATHLKDHMTNIFCIIDVTKIEFLDTNV